MRTKIKLFITFFLIYVYFIHWVGWSENSRVNLTRAIVDEHRFEVDSYHNNTSDRAYYNGHYYSDKAPGVSFIASPIYAAFKFIYYGLTPDFIVEYVESETRSNEYNVRYVGSGGVPIYDSISPGFFILTSIILVTAFTSPIFTALTVVLVYGLTKYFTQNELYRLGVAAVYGLGTLAFPTALVFMSSPAGTFFVFLAFCLIFVAKKENSGKGLYVSGLALGFAVVCDYPSIIVSLMLLFYVAHSFRDRRVVLRVFSAFLVGLSPLLLYNYIIFGSPFKLTLQYNDPGIWGMASDSELRHYGFISPSNPYIMLRLVLFPYRGLFFYYPLLLLSIVGLSEMYCKNKAEAILFLLMFLSFITLYSGRRLWYGGATFGIRYMLPTIPFLMMPLTCSLKKINTKVVSALILMSVFINIIGLQEPEDDLLDKKALYIDRVYLKKQETTRILRHPLADHYLPLFLEYGPRSRIFEQASNLIVNIDIRDFRKPQRFFVPFLSLVPPLILVPLIWSNEILKLLSKKYS